MDTGGRRGFVLGAVAFGVLAFGVQVALLAGSAVAGVVAAAAFAVTTVVVAVEAQRRGEARAAVALASEAPPSLQGVLDFTGLPAYVSAHARDALPAVARQASGLSVRVDVDGPWLRFRKRRVLAGGSAPFELRLPLASVTAVRPGPLPQRLVGSSITFDHIEGSVRVELAVAESTAAELAGRLAEAAERQRVFDEGHVVGGLEVTTPPPPPRTPVGRALLMELVVTVVFLAAMAGAPGGVCATVAAVGLLSVSTMCAFYRPRSMGVVLGCGANVVAVAFVVDAILTGEPVRLVGAAAALACGVWIRALTPSPPNRERT